MNEATKTGAFAAWRLKRSLSAQVGRWPTGFGLFGFRGWAAAAIVAALAFVLVGTVTAMIDNPFFVRMTPVRMQDYIVWISTALLMGLVGGSFTVRGVKGGIGRGTSGGLLSFFAVGCPICNKLVVALLGISGALAYFAPLQVYLGTASVALLLWSLHLRLRAMSQGCCTLP
jgi:hypothetical protein